MAPECNRSLERNDNGVARIRELHTIVLTLIPTAIPVPGRASLLYLLLSNPPEISTFPRRNGSAR